MLRSCHLETKYMEFFFFFLIFFFQAQRAGDNAFRQMKIALRSSDPYVLNKCWLFVAMSLMQQGQLKRSKHIIYHIHNSVKEHDEVLSRMCKGIWARLQYTWKNPDKTANKR